MKRSESIRSGFALYAVLAAIAVVALVAGGVLGYARYAMRTTSRFLRDSERRLAAQTVLEGVKMCLNAQYRAWFQQQGSIQNALDWFDGWSATAVGAAGFSYDFPVDVSRNGFSITATLVAVEKNPVATTAPYARLKLRAVAVEAGSDATSSLAIDETVDFGLKRAGVFDHAYFSDHFGELTDQSVVNGSASSNGDFVVDDASLVNGNVAAAGVVHGSETVDFWDILEYWQRASERARPTNPPGQDESFEYPMGYDPPSEDDDLEQLQPGQEPVEMPFIGDLASEKALAVSMGGSLRQGGATLVNGVYGVDRAGPSGVADAEDRGCLVINGANGVLQIDGPVVIDRDVVFQGKVTVSGQGTIYAGRNVHILGNIVYANAPSWPKPDPDPEATIAANAATDLLGLVAKGNIVFDAYWKQNPWQSDVSEMLAARLASAPPPYDCDPSDATLGYCASNGPYEFNGNYFGADGMQKVASITFKKVMIGGRIVIQKTTTSAPSRFYESLVYDGMLSASTITRVDAVLYSNHAVLGKIGNIDINGSLVTRDDIMTPLNWTEFDWDIRLGSQSLDGLDFPILLPMVVADPKVVGWKEVLL